MDEEVAKTEYCSNCRRDIPAANFVMHVTHCQRNLTLCKVCGEPIPTSQQEEHYEEYHAKDKCDCGQLVEKMNLEEHKEKDCPNRDVECQYCELTLPFSKMASHIEYCGSRTEKCDTCDRFIQMKDFTEHVNTACQYPVKEESKKFPSKPADDLFSEMPVDMLHALGLMDPSVGNPDYFHPLVAGMHEFGQIINTGLGTSPFSDARMQYPGDAAYFGGINAGNGVIDGRDVIPRGARGGRAVTKPEFDWPTFRDFDKVDDEYSQDVDDDEMLAAACQAEGSIDGLSSAMVDEPFPHMKSTLMSDSVNDKTQLPCEFCGDLFPVDSLILHQSGCQLRSLDSFPGSAPPFPDDITEHNLLQVNNSTFSVDREFQTNHTEVELKETNGSGDDTFLPCEFCQELFPFDSLVVHQAVCDACPTSRPSSALPGPPLNNARPPVRNGSKSRPSRPVYVKTQRSLEDFIPSELDSKDIVSDDSSQDLDFTNVNDNLTTKVPIHKPEIYSDRYGGQDDSPMNNELQRQERKTSDQHSMRGGQTVLRNNDLANRQSSKDVLRVKNRTEAGKRLPEPRSGLSSTTYKAPAVKSMEDGLSQKTMTTEPTRSKPRPRDSATRSKPHQASMNDYTERSRREHKATTQLSHKSDARPSKPRRTDSGGLNSAMRVPASRGSRTKAQEPLPPVNHLISLNGSSLHSAPSNPRRNPPTTNSVDQGVRSNRGRPRPQGPLESVRPSNTQSSTPPRKTSSTRKKIV